LKSARSARAVDSGLLAVQVFRTPLLRGKRAPARPKRSVFVALQHEATQFRQSERATQRLVTYIHVCHTFSEDQLVHQNRPKNKFSCTN